MKKIISAIIIALAGVSLHAQVVPGIEVLEQDGFKQDGVKNLRVCIGVFNTEAEAESFAKGINSGYWVLK